MIGNVVRTMAPGGIGVVERTMAAAKAKKATASRGGAFGPRLAVDQGTYASARR